MTPSRPASMSSARPGRGILNSALNRIDPIDPATAKEGVLGEVRALQPNHENRLEAIERAEKIRIEKWDGERKCSGGDECTNQKETVGHGRT
ncbi:Bud site selection protein 6 [Ciborinia camelliae]|nr:Bud site selection protein 6 [Ciborinia camelliae]